MKYEILNDKNEVINTIIADLSFVKKLYPGRYRAIIEPPVEEAEPIIDPLTEIKNKLDSLIVDVKEIKNKVK